MTKILCIDDMPDEILEQHSGKTLKDFVCEIFNDTPYKVSFEKTGDEGVRAATNDKEIKLVLLDIEFENRMDGPKIADALQTNAPHTKIIVLTRHDQRGKKISFGWKPNVVRYVLKSEITMQGIQNKLRNLCKAVIEDFSNKNWILRYEDNSDVITLFNTETKKSYGIDIPLTSKPALLTCMQKPNCPVDLPIKEFGKNLNKVHNSVNENVVKKTEWNTWGILAKEDCAKGQLKLVVGSVELLPSQTSNDLFVTQSKFENFIRDFEAFKQETLKRLEEILKKLYQ